MNSGTKSTDTERLGLHAGDQFEFHPFSAMLPLLDDEEYDALVFSIRKNGIINPITLFDGKILDGRNRYRAAVEAGHKFTDRDFTQLRPGQDPIAFVLGANVQRRQLNAQQKRQLITKLIRQYPNASDPEIAKMASVDRKTVGSVRTERKKWTDDMKAKWKDLSPLERRAFVGEFVTEIQTTLVELSVASGAAPP